MATKILLVDDDARYVRMLSRYLENHEFEVHSAGNLQEAYAIINKQNIDIALIDLNLPDGHGFDLSHHLRSNSTAGIIIASGSGEQIDKIVGLEIGGDDYIVKPFENRELLARIRSVLRRTLQAPVGSYLKSVDAKGSKASFDRLVCDFSRHVLETADGVPILLTSQEFRLLEVLARNSGKILSRDKLMDLIRGKDWSPTDRSIDVMIGKIRKKLNSQLPDINIIVTVRGEGYRFASEVVWSIS